MTHRTTATNLSALDGPLLLSARCVCDICAPVQPEEFPGYLHLMCVPILHLAGNQIIELMAIKNPEVLAEER